MKKLIAGMVMALAVLGTMPSSASAHGEGSTGGGCGWYQPPIVDCGHWELRSYCQYVWVDDGCGCGHWEMRTFQRWVWVRG